jgi:mannose-1-phosphate guanylyltransferase/mannose-6-phosphate isomerase
MIPIVLSGGSGTRLWPISRRKFPKQFCEIFNESLQNLTLKRVSTLGNPMLVTGQDLKTLTEIHIKKSEVNVRQVLYEPKSKNTGPAVLVACEWLKSMGHENECVGFFPADHLIQDEEEFLSAVKLAQSVAESGKIVTLGVRPTYPETGYGYIQKTKKSLQEGSEIFGVVQFHEKPNLETAKKFLLTQEYLWNAGIFIGRVKDFLSSFEKFQNDMRSEAKKLKSDLSNLLEVYEKMPNISLDYAIMEKLSVDQLSVVPVDLGWNDVGSWDAVADHFRARGLSSKGTTVLSTGTDHNHFVFSQTGREVALVEVDNLIVVDTADTLLIASKGSSQKVREIVDQLNQKKSKLAEEPTFEDRPWGHFQILKDTEHFKSKVIQVWAKSQISYQSHGKRAEHWIITQGKGEVVLNDQIIPVQAGSHVHIPLGAKHRIRNTTDHTLEFVEVQLGSYFGEDDIVRYSDDYNRAPTKSVANQAEE